MMLSKYAILALALISAVVSQTVEVGHCQVVGTSNDPTIGGYIEFITNGNLVQMNVNVSGITVNPDSDHGIHIHQWGDLGSTDATRTGTHWNPTGVAHGCPDSPITTRHYGDTGNWTAAGGLIIGTKYLDLISLTGTYSIIGFAVIIHQQVDNCNATTSAGSRLAQCVIGIANPSNYNATTNNAYPSPVAPDNNATRGVCRLVSTAGNTAYGDVFFEPQNNGTSILVRAILNGLVDGSVHGLHIHAFGDLRTANGLGTGGHWNPTNSNHGIPPYAIRHVGDLGNVYFYNGGIAYYEYTFTIFGLNSATYNIIGRGVILHNLTDDCGQPLGNAGARLAQCVIGYANPASTYSWPVGISVPNTQNETRCLASTTGAEVTTGVAPVTTGVTVAPATTGLAPVTTGVARPITSGAEVSSTAGEQSSSSASALAFFALLAIIAVLFA